MDLHQIPPNITAEEAAVFCREALAAPIRERRVAAGLIANSPALRVFFDPSARKETARLFADPELREVLMQENEALRARRRP